VAKVTVRVLAEHYEQYLISEFRTAAAGAARAAKGRASTAAEKKEARLNIIVK